MNSKNQMYYRLAADVREICKSLFQIYGITYFGYSRVYPDNRIAILTTLPEWREFFINSGFQNIAVLDNKNIRKKIGKYRIWDAHAAIYPNSTNLRIQQEAKKRFDLHHGLAICRDNLNFSERFTFATCEKNHSINEFYEHSQDIFKKFTLYFKDQASSLIQLAGKHCIDYPTNMNKKEISIPEFEFNEKIKIGKFYIETAHGSTYLTLRELDCINWALKGKTIEETSIILNVSQDTIKTHIFNAKKKLNVTKMIDIFRMLKEQDILDVNKR